jgi:hypothetical protein
VRGTLQRSIFFISWPFFLLGLLLPVYGLEIGADVVQIGLFFSAFSLMTGASWAMVSPLLIIFLQESLGASVETLAWAYFPSALVWALLPSRLGGLADRFGRKPLMVLGLVAARPPPRLLPTPAPLADRTGQGGHACVRIHSVHSWRNVMADETKRCRMVNGSIRKRK